MSKASLYADIQKVLLDQRDPEERGHGRPLEERLQECLACISAQDENFEELGTILNLIHLRLNEEQLPLKAKLQRAQFKLQYAQITGQNTERLAGISQAMGLKLANAITAAAPWRRRNLIDVEFYLKENEDVAQSGANPISHYVKFGAREGRIPSDLRAEFPECFHTKALQHTGTLTDLYDREDAIFASDCTPDVRNHAFDILRPDSPSVSVIVPTWNRASTIRTAIDSALYQSYPATEIIVIDDGSVDGTVPMLKESYQDEIKARRVKLIENPHQGVSAARNTGLASANGDIIAYLDSDNLWEGDHLLYLCATMTDCNRKSAYTALNRHDLQNGWSDILYKTFDEKTLHEENYIDMNTFAHKSSLSQQVKFDETLDRFVDWDFILRLTKEYPPASVPIMTAHYFLDEGVLENITTSIDGEENLRKIRGKLNAAG